VKDSGKERGAPTKWKKISPEGWNGRVKKTIQRDGTLMENDTQYGQVPLNYCGWALSFSVNINKWSPALPSLISPFSVFHLETFHIHYELCLAWWHTPLIPALRRQRQADFWVQGQPGLQSEFQNSQGYTEKPYLEKQTNKQKPNKQVSLLPSLPDFLSSTHNSYPGCGGVWLESQQRIRSSRLPSAT
jgi:hypothetical protein